MRRRGNRHITRHALCQIGQTASGTELYQNDVIPQHSETRQRATFCALHLRLTGSEHQRTEIHLHYIQTIVRKGKVNVKVTLEQATKVQRGSRGIALLFF
jgi:hypothetical protein